MCRQWRALAGDMCYEYPYWARYHYAACGRGAEQACFRKLAFTYVSIATAIASPGPSRHPVSCARRNANMRCPTGLALLALLQHLEVLERPPIYPLPTPLRFEFPTAELAFPSLHRLEWDFDKTGVAARAGGGNSLRDMLKAAPSVHHFRASSHSSDASRCAFTKIA